MRPTHTRNLMCSGAMGEGRQGAKQFVSPRVICLQKANVLQFVNKNIFRFMLPPNLLSLVLLFAFPCMYLLAGAWRLVCHRLVFASLFTLFARSQTPTRAPGFPGLSGMESTKAEATANANCGEAGPRADKMENTALRL